MIPPLLRRLVDRLPPGSEAEIPARLELQTSWAALGILRRHLGAAGAAAVALEITWARARGRPFERLPPPADRREAASRQQAGPAILLYRALRRRVGRDAALAITGEAVVAGAVLFLGHAVGRIDRAELLALSESERAAKVRGIGARFFNATARWDEISGERVRFTVTRCAFPGLCAAAGAPEVAPLLCAGDAVYFGEVLGTVDLDRPTTIADGALSCPFTLRWREV